MGSLHITLEAAVPKSAASIMGSSIPVETFLVISDTIIKQVIGL
jgi:hypothetical protein